MSRVGKKPLVVPAGVDLKIEGRTVRVKGPKGELTMELHPHVTLVKEGQEVRVEVADPELVKDRALWGLFRRLLDNMVTGVTKGYEKKLEINGVGYKAALQGKTLKLEVGYSHGVDFPIPPGVTVTVEKNVITVTGIDKQFVGEVAAMIRRVKKPEPYQGKGIKYVDEVIRRKAGKTAKSSA
ncbi:MAG: 50S ribosomal protein L6 [Patescibacteria group bacterium]|nr:50S ribosomal protein L6 [Patescibacteria group bacterium]